MAAFLGLIQQETVDYVCESVRGSFLVRMCIGLYSTLLALHSSVLASQSHHASLAGVGLILPEEDIPLTLPESCPGCTLDVSTCVKFPNGLWFH